LDGWRGKKRKKETEGGDSVFLRGEKKRRVVQKRALLEKSKKHNW